jgi:hypothetical protein
VLLIQAPEDLLLFVDAFRQYSSRPAAECSYTQIMCQTVRAQFRTGAPVCDGQYLWETRFGEEGTPWA